MPGWQFFDQTTVDHLPPKMPMIPLRGQIAVPDRPEILFIGRTLSKAAIAHSMANERYVFLAMQKNPEREDVAQDDIHSMGVIARLEAAQELDDGRIKVLLTGLVRAKLQSMELKYSYLEAELEKVVGSDLELSSEIQIIVKEIKSATENSEDFLQIEQIFDQEISRWPDLLLALLKNKEKLATDCQKVLDQLTPREQMKQIAELFKLLSGARLE